MTYGTQSERNLLRNNTIKLSLLSEYLLLLLF